MTQGEFMRRGAPGASLDNAPGKFSSNESAARYFRKIVSGERTGGAMYRAGREHGTVGIFQIKSKIGGRHISQNITVTSGFSTFDIPAIEHELKTTRRKEAEQLADKYRTRYGMEDADVADFLDEMEVRTIKTQKKPIRMRLSIA